MKRRPHNSIGLRAIADVLMTATDDGEGHSTVAVSAVTLHGLGAQILRIADGEDARAVLAPGRRGRRSDEGRNYAAALTYWRHRARHPADRDGAVECARLAAAELSNTAAGTIERHARRWRVVILAHVLPAIGIEPVALLNYLAKKSKRGRS